MRLVLAVIACALAAVLLAPVTLPVLGLVALAVLVRRRRPVLVNVRECVVYPREGGYRAVVTLADCRDVVLDRRTFADALAAVQQQVGA